MIPKSFSNIPRFWLTKVPWRCRLPYGQQQHGNFQMIADLPLAKRQATASCRVLQWKQDPGTYSLES